MDTPVFDFDNVTGKIVHPNNASIVFHVRKPDDVAKMEYFISMGNVAIPVAIMNASENTPIFEAIRDDEGEPQFYKNGEPRLQVLTKDLQTIPVQVMASFFKRHIISAEGIKNRSGQILTDTSHLASVVFSPKLNYTEEGKEGHSPFWQHFAEKLTDEATFDLDPLV